MSIRPLILTPLLAAVAATTAYGDPDAPASVAPLSVRPLVGAYIPSGAQHRELKSSILTGAELAYAPRATLRLVGSATWAPSRDKRLANDRANLTQLDAGAEWAPGAASDEGWRWSPFLGAGLGVRRYAPKQDVPPAQSDPAGYGSLGGELDRRGFGLRAELRDYVSRFEEQAGATKSTRNDLMLTAALTLHM